MGGKKSVHKNRAQAQHHTEVGSGFWSEEALLPAHSLMLPSKSSNGDARVPSFSKRTQESTKENCLALWGMALSVCPEWSQVRKGSGNKRLVMVTLWRCVAGGSQEKY